MAALSKLAWLLLRPDNLCLLALGLGVVLLWLPGGRGRRLGRWFASAAFAVFAATLLLHLGVYAVTPLENRFPAPAVLPAHVDGIVVLGGAFSPDVVNERGLVAVGEAAPRLDAARILAERYPGARIVLSGGGSNSLDNSRTEAGSSAVLLIRLGIASERLVLERRSANTYENAVYSKALAAPRPGEVWLLVTSAVHMPRAVGVFRAQGWAVVPYPVDYQTEGKYLTDPQATLADEFEALDLAVREWTGLLAYRLLGRTETLFPAP